MKSNKRSNGKAPKPRKTLSTNQVDKYPKHFNNVDRVFTEQDYVNVEQALGHKFPTKVVQPTSEFIENIRQQARHMACKPFEVPDYKSWETGPDNHIESHPANSGSGEPGFTHEDRAWTINDLANLTQPFIRDILRQNAPGGGIPQEHFIWSDLPEGLEIEPIQVPDNEILVLIRRFEKVNEEFTALDYMRFRQVHVQRNHELARPRIEAPWTQARPELASRYNDFISNPIPAITIFYQVRATMCH